MGNTYYEQRSLHNFPRMARGKDKVEVKSMIDLVLVKKDMLHYEQEVRAMREMGQGLSDHHVVLRKIRLVGAWIKRKEVVDGVRGLELKN